MSWSEPCDCDILHIKFSYASMAAAVLNRELEVSSEGRVSVMQACIMPVPVSGAVQVSPSVAASIDTEGMAMAKVPVFWLLL
jgi:hypothetical protein